MRGASGWWRRLLFVWARRASGVRAREAEVECVWAGSVLADGAHRLVSSAVGFKLRSEDSNLSKSASYPPPMKSQ